MYTGFAVHDFIDNFWVQSWRFSVLHKMDWEFYPQEVLALMFPSYVCEYHMHTESNDSTAWQIVMCQDEWLAASNSSWY